MSTNTDYSIFGAIDIGSNETSLRLYEISKSRGIHLLEHVYHTAHVGYESYSTGHISFESTIRLCDILLGFKEKMAEYRVSDHMVVATSALREAENALLVTDRIKQRTGFDVRILSNSEQRYMYYKAIALKPNAFHKLIQKNTLLVDVGGGSVQLSLFDKNTLITTQNIRLGSLRVHEILQSMRNETDSYQNLVYEYISNSLHTFTKLYLSDYRIKNIIAVGNQMDAFAKYLSVHNFGNLQPTDSKGRKKDSVSRSEYEEFYQAISTQPADDLAEELNISVDKANLLLPTAMIYHNVIDEVKAEQMWLSGITLGDGLAADYAERKERITPAHSFFEDIISVSMTLARRFKCEEKHIKNVEENALSIFDAIRKGNHFKNRDRLLLQIASILHNCGNFVNMNDVGENSYKIVMSTEIIGISHLERLMVANIVRYNSESFPAYDDLKKDFTRDEYIKIVKLNSILSLADVMDKSHKQKFNNIKAQIEENELHIYADSTDDITLEQGMFKLQAKIFEVAFGINPILINRRRF